jgi:GT2 family glycosyltransferase
MAPASVAGRGREQSRVVDVSHQPAKVQLDRVWAVVVHHRHLHTLPTALASILASGVAPDHIVCVDNSETAVEAAALEAVLPAGVSLLRVPNAGFGDAANQGVAAVRDHTEEVDAVLLCTHEVHLAPDCTSILRAALRDDALLGAVGPVLSLSGEHGRVWSTGGFLTTLLRHPRHRTDPLGGAPRETEWLDGAVVLYRAPAVFDRVFETDYFLYLEENDLHQQLRAAGLRIAVVPTAHASQDTAGMPDYYAARNMVLFQRRWGRPGLRLLSAALFVGRRALAAVLHGRLPSRDLGRGFRDGLGTEKKPRM